MQYLKMNKCQKTRSNYTRFEIHCKSVYIFTRPKCSFVFKWQQLCQRNWLESPAIHVIERNNMLESCKKTNKTQCYDAHCLYIVLLCGGNERNPLSNYWVMAHTKLQQCLSSLHFHCFFKVLVFHFLTKSKANLTSHSFYTWSCFVEMTTIEYLLKYGSYKTAKMPKSVQTFTVYQSFSILLYRIKNIRTRRKMILLNTYWDMACTNIQKCPSHISISCSYSVQSLG